MSDYDSITTAQYCIVCGTQKPTTVMRYLDDETLEYVIDQPEGHQVHVRNLGDGTRIDESHVWRSGADPIWQVFVNHTDREVWLDCTRAMHDDDVIIAEGLLIAEAVAQTRTVAVAHGYRIVKTFSELDSTEG